MDDLCKAAYIAAFIDGEGHIGLSQIKKTGHYTREIVYSNTDKALFDAVTQMCRDLGFPVSVYYTPRQLPWHDHWRGRLSGSKEVYERFLEMIPLQAPRKVQRLKEVIKSYTDPDAVTEQRRNGDSLTCAHCGTGFYAARHRRAKFCCEDCHKAARVNLITKICQTCHASFEVKQARSQAKFCSLSCSGKAQSDRLSALGKKTIGAARYARAKRIIASGSKPPTG